MDFIWPPRSSRMDFIWPPRSRCEIHHYSTRFAHRGCKTRSISDQIAKVQRLTVNAIRPVSGNVKNADTFAPLPRQCFVADNLSSPLGEGAFVSDRRYARRPLKSSRAARSGAR